MDTSDANGFVLKTQHNTDKLDIQKKIDEPIWKCLILLSLIKKQITTQKITEIEGKIARITGLATTSALNPFENKIPNASDLVDEIDCNVKYKTPHLIINFLSMKYSTQRKRKRGWLISLNFLSF